jgi:hypothetical protein
MTLSELRSSLPLRNVSPHARSHRDESCDFDLLARPEQLNVLADRLATPALVDLCAYVTRLPGLYS